MKIKVIARVTAESKCDVYILKELFAMSFGQVAQPCSR